MKEFSVNPAASLQEVIYPRCYQVKLRDVKIAARDKLIFFAC